ncbi:MAG: TolB family protein [Actinomycetota bacterium]
MAGIDDRLRRDLERLARPADSAGAFEQVSDRRRRAGYIHRAQVLALVVAVLAASAGGTWALTRAFRLSDEPDRTASGTSVRNGKIAFLSDRAAGADPDAQDIYTVDPATGEISRVTQVSMYSSELSWSPDGTRIVFDIGIAKGEGEIVIVGADGTGMATVTTFDDPQGPAWSPDGDRIAFYPGNPGSPPIAIHLVDVVGGHPVQVTHPGVDCIDLSPAWSPDGAEIAFVRQCNPDEASETNELIVVRADGSGARVLTDLGPGSLFLSWSPDGRTIAFAREGRISTIQVDGTGLRQLTTAGDGNPVWSPDGSKIAFDSSRDGNSEIYVMNADGTGQTNVTNHSANDFSPAWQPVPAGPSPTSSEQPPTPAPTSPPEDECRTSSVNGDFDGDDVEDTATVALTSCLVPEPEEGSPFTTEYALNVKWPPAEGIFPLPDCKKACRALAAVDFDGDGTDEFVLVVDAGASTEFLRFYELPPRETGPVPLTVAPPGTTEYPAGEPLELSLWGSVTHLGFVTCRTVDGAGQLIATGAELFTDPDNYTVREAVFELEPPGEDQPGQFRVVSERTYEVPFDQMDAFDAPGEPCWTGPLPP